MSIFKLLASAVSFLCFTLSTFAQKNNAYISNWKQIEQYEKKGLTRSALVEAVKIFNLAVASSNDAQQIKSAMYQMKYRNMVENDNRVNNIFYLDTLIAKAKTPARNILQSMQAELFWSYAQNNRRLIYNRTELVKELSHDITTWTAGKLNAVIANLYKASLHNPDVLKKTLLNDFDPIITKGINTRNLRPTLYDLLGHRALDYFMNDENNVTQPAYKFILNDERIFEPVASFINIRFATRDTSSLYFSAILLLQDMLKFHLGDADKSALVDADLIRLLFMHQHGIITDKDKLYENALKSIENNFDKTPSAAQAMFLRAQLYYESGLQYNQGGKKEFINEFKKAVLLAEEAVRNFPASEGGINSKNLISQIKQPSLEFEIEKVNVPEQAFRSLVKYKNINNIYLRVIKVSRQSIKNLEGKEYELLWKEISQMSAIKSWTVKLPASADFQQHSTEIKVDPLPAGTYILLASINSDFGRENNILAKLVTYISNISYIINDKQEMYILNRDNGEPLKGAVVQTWVNQYNYSSRKNEEIKKDKYTADANGFIKLKAQPKNSYGQYLFQVNYKNEELFSNDEYYINSYNTFEKRSSKQTFLFTDRSIYRPGQELFFKGIAVYTDSTRKKSNLLTGFNTTLILFDANNQKAGRLLLSTNEYGSYNGKFILPALLNGQFRIIDSVTQSVRYFNVEEYKRPKFITEIKKPEGTYKLNDSITITGNAKAYAGNSIDNALVTYRVVRKVRYPPWFGWGYKMWPPYGNTDEMEIINGQVYTDTEGNFKITFKAIPDEAVDKKSQPVFYYEVTADVTDINGETRSGITTVAVAYQALQLNIAIGEKILADSLKDLRISTTNLNDIYEKATVNLSIYKLVSPARIFRSRYWSAPDQFVMSREEFYNYFPYDVYSNEDQASNWAIEKKVIDITDTTKQNKPYSDKITIPEPGWYKIIVTTKDKYGEDVKAEKYIEIISGKTTGAPIAIAIDKNTAGPGNSINYSLITVFDKIWLIHKIIKADDIKTTYPVITAASPLKDQMNITEADRGGIVLNYTFIKHNRVYTNEQSVAVPWNNKDLIITYETFRDKVLPGSEEKWKIKLSGSNGEKVAAEILVSMYDASLDQFKSHSWNNLKSLWPLTTGSVNWTKNTFESAGSVEYNKIKINYTQPLAKSYDALLNNGWNEGYYYRRETIMLRGAATIQANAPMMDDQSGMLDVMMESRSKVATGNATKKETDSVVILKPKINQPGFDNMEIRKNFNETAFFFPLLTTDGNGSVEFSFTIPEALTQWKLMTLAHTKDLASAYSEKTVITQKPLMVQPNPPRFTREGDQLTLVTKVVNMNDKPLSGKITLGLADAINNRSVDGLYKNIQAIQNFSVAPGQSIAIAFPISIPVGFNSALLYRIKAITNADADGTTFSDGEEAVLPVLSNRMLVTETLPLNMRNTDTKTFRFDKLLNSSASSTLTNHALTFEFTSNPVWYAVQALPFLMEYPYDCAEQTFNRYYANTLAGSIASSTPRLKTIFEKWKITDTAALLSNLQKNTELKSVLLEETPWVLQAENEAQQKKNIALLFDMVRMSAEKNKSLAKLKEMQSTNGGFMWFKGGPDDRYMTQYIISGIGHLRKLNSFSGDDYEAVKMIVNKALPYLDSRINEEYKNLIKLKVDLKKNNLSNTAIQYLYMRSFFPEYKVSETAAKAHDYYAKQAVTYWLSQSKYMQGMIALFLQRSGEIKSAKAIIESLKQNAIYQEEMGMYWKDFTGGYYWHQAPIESQAMMIEAFTDIEGNTVAVDDMKTWLLKQKQTQNWRTTKATAEACYALLLNGSNWLAEEKVVTINAGNKILTSSGNTTEAGSGYFKQTIPGHEVQQGMGNITISLKQGNNNNNSVGNSTSWGAAYWQYFEEMDKITFAATPLKLVKKLYIEQNSDRGPVLKEVKEGDVLHVGDKIKVRIELKVDRDMEYVHMKDMRAAALEPVNVISQYKYQGGLGYYESTKDASTNFFFNWLPRGSYVFEYPLFISQSGSFSNGITTIQCMYAPEFTSHSNGNRITVAGR